MWLISTGTGAAMVPLGGNDLQRLRLARVLGDDREAAGELGGDVHESPADLGAGLLDEDRHALVAPLAQRRGDRDLAQKRNAEFLGGALGAPAREYIVLFMALIADEVAH